MRISWGKRKQKVTGVAAKDIAVLAPFVHLGQEQIDGWIDTVERLQFPEGLLDERLDSGTDYFLDSGQIQIQASSGHMLTLRGSTPQARYRLPRGDCIKSLYASEDIALLAIPSTASPERDHTAKAEPKPIKLTSEEQTALNGLASEFRNKHCELPSLPDLAIKIGKAIDDRNNANEDISRLIQLDPSLTARILSVVNSAAFGGVSEIKTVSQATNRLGRHKIRSIVYSTLLKGVFKISSSALKHRMESLWGHSAHVAALAFVLGRVTPGIDPEQAMLAGLIHDIGSVSVLGGINRYPVLARRPEVLEFTLQHLHLTATSITLEKWGLRDRFLDVAKNADNWMRIGSAIPETTDAVILARMHALIGSPLQRELPPINGVPAFAKLANGELTPRNSLAILDKAESDVREVRALIGAA